MNRQNAKNAKEKTQRQAKGWKDRLFLCARGAPCGSLFLTRPS
jgi:hypothetical protein